MSACSSVHIPRIFGDDEVPQSVKDAPRTVEPPQFLTDGDVSPRLGDVPFKPKDFSTKPAYNQSMDDLETLRIEGEAVKKSVEVFDEPQTDVAPQSDPVIQPPEF
ncbi:MAG: hypothetical protein PHE27_04810 [Alphaproteobacteria bacterium]|nr:hypothetical protein [Alphaproteobacteria bacterium]